MDKLTTLRALLSSPFITSLDSGVTSRIAFVPVRSSAEPVLIFCQSEAVGWIRIEEANAIWRYGSMLTGGSSQPRVLGDPSQDGGRIVARAFEAAWEELNPEWATLPLQTGEAERFAACVESGQRPPPWSHSGGLTAPQSATPDPLQQEVSRPEAAVPTPDSTYATKFNAYARDRTRHAAAPGFTEQALDGRILETVHPAVVPAAVGGAALFLAILAMPYDFYVLLRWVVPAMAIWICIIAGGQKKTAWAVAFTLVALLWNPLIPFEMTRSSWTFPDIIGAVLFAMAGAKLLASKPALRPDDPSWRR